MSISRLIVTYLLCGVITEIYACFDAYRNGELDPYNASDDDEETIARIFFLWWLYIYHKLNERGD